MTVIFDMLYFRKNARGDIVFYPHGPWFGNGGYLVPAEREPNMRSGMRRIWFAALIAGIVCVVLVPFVFEWVTGIAPSKDWVGIYGLFATIVAGGIINRYLSRLTAGLQPVP